MERQDKGDGSFNPKEVSDALLKLITLIVDDSASVGSHIHESENSIIFEISVADSDYGKIVGKNGRMANAIRTIVRAIAGSFNKRLVIEFSFSKKK